MATITQTQHRSYNIEELLQIYNPAKGRWSCVGYAPSQHRRCQNPIAVHNRTTANALLQTVSHGTNTALQIRHALLQIAKCLLCRHYHQSQAYTVAAEWYAIMIDNVPVPPITPVVPSAVPQYNTYHDVIAGPGAQSDPVTDPGATLDAATALIPRDFVVQFYELAASHDRLHREISELRQQCNEETRAQSGNLHGPAATPVTPSIVYPITIDTQVPTPNAEPDLDAAPDPAFDPVPAPAVSPLSDAVQNPIPDCVPDRIPNSTLPTYVPSMSIGAAVTENNAPEEAQQDDHETRDGNDNQRPELQAVENTFTSEPISIQPSRSTVRNARAPFIAAIEAQERLRREAEAETTRLREESEAQQRREEEIEERRRREAESAERQRFERERSLREAEELECAERQRAEQRRIEREQAQAESETRHLLLQRVARREQQSPVSSRSTSEERSRMLGDEDQDDWTQSWSRYEQDWENMSRIDTFGLDEDVRDSLPWPVRSGHWHDVDTAAVRCFFDNAPHTEPEDRHRIRFLQLLRLQIWRWHENRVRRLFPTIAGDAEAAQLITVVIQTVNAMMEEIRSY